MPNTNSEAVPASIMGVQNLKHHVSLGRKYGDVYLQFINQTHLFLLSNEYSEGSAEQLIGAPSTRNEFLWLNILPRRQIQWENKTAVKAAMRLRKSSIRCVHEYMLMTWKALATPTQTKYSDRCVSRGLRVF